MGTDGTRIGAGRGVTRATPTLTRANPGSHRRGTTQHPQRRPFTNATPDNARPSAQRCGTDAGNVPFGAESGSLSI